MRPEMFADRLDFAIRHAGLQREVAYAALNDFVRSLHEVFIKSGCDQASLLSQVQVVLGPAAAHHLGRLISRKKVELRSYPADDRCPLAKALTQSCRERGIALDTGMSLFSHLLTVLGEKYFDDQGTLEPPVFIAYWGVGDEAAYHLAGLHSGDDMGMLYTSLELLDHRLKRFGTTVQRWKMELAWDKEEQG